MQYQEHEASTSRTRITCGERDEVEILRKKVENKQKLMEVRVKLLQNTVKLNESHELDKVSAYLS